MIDKQKKSEIIKGYQSYKSPSIFHYKEESKPFKFPFSLTKVIFYLVVLFGLVFFFFLSSTFRVKEIIVEGNNLVSREEILTTIKPGQNIFRFNSKKTKTEILKKLPAIRDLEIYRGIPNAIKVVIVEREGRVVWQTKENRYLISASGEVSKQISFEEYNELPLIVDQKGLSVTPGKPLVSPNFIAFIINISDSFFSETNTKIKNFEVIETTLDIHVLTDAGFYIKLNTLRSSKKQLESLKLVLMQKRADIHEYVDLRVDGWAYYK